MHAGVSDLAESNECSHSRTHRCCLPPSWTTSALSFINMSRLNTPPACAPVNASLPALRLRAHDSEPVWLARPSPYGSFIHTSTPVYPGAPMISNSNSLCRERDAQSKTAAFYFTPFLVPSCPAYEPNSNAGEYSQPFRHIQYNRTASRRPIAILAMLLCRRIARSMYRRFQSG